MRTYMVYFTVNKREMTDSIRATDSWDAMERMMKERKLMPSQIIKITEVAC